MLLDKNKQTKNLREIVMEDLRGNPGETILLETEELVLVELGGEYSLYYHPGGQTLNLDLVISRKPELVPLLFKEDLLVPTPESNEEAIELAQRIMIPSIHREVCDPLPINSNFSLSTLQLAAPA